MDRDKSLTVRCVFEEAGDGNGFGHQPRSRRVGGRYRAALSQVAEDLLAAAPEIRPVDLIAIK